MIPGGLNREGFANLICTWVSWGVRVVETAYGGVKKCLWILSLRMNFCMSTNVENLFNVLGGTYFKPLSRTSFSSSIRLTELRLKTPEPIKFLVFLLWTLHSPRMPLFLPDFLGTPAWPCENPNDGRDLSDFDYNCIETEWTDLHLSLCHHKNSDGSLSQYSPVRQKIYYTVNTSGGPILVLITIATIIIPVVILTSGWSFRTLVIMRVSWVSPL